MMVGNHDIFSSDRLGRTSNGVGIHPGFEPLITPIPTPFRALAGVH
jgi:hypothetical protein